MIKNYWQLEFMQRMNIIHSSLSYLSKFLFTSTMLIFGSLFLVLVLTPFPYMCNFHKCIVWPVILPSGSVKVLVAQLCLTLRDWSACSLPGSSVHVIFQARILEWFAISFSRGSSQPRDQTWVSLTTGRFFTDWTTGEAPIFLFWTFGKWKYRFHLISKID